MYSVSVLFENPDSELQTIGTLACLKLNIVAHGYTINVLSLQLLWKELMAPGEE